jgi:hypothetical protein
MPFARHAKSLPILQKRRSLVLIFESEAADTLIQMLEVPQYRAAPIVHSDRIAQANQCRSKASYDLDRSCAELSYLIERQRHILVPCRHSEYHADRTANVTDQSRVELSTPKPS